jgi:caffeoyl-CoA O-methyltransferase
MQTLDARLAAGAAGQYDFAFIDAAKTSYDGYYERCMKLLRPGGLIAFDNTLWSGAVARPAQSRPSVMAALQALTWPTGRARRSACANRRRADAGA